MDMRKHWINNSIVWRLYLADTLVVNETHWFTKVSGVEPVISSHWAGVVPPRAQNDEFIMLNWCFHAHEIFSLSEVNRPVILQSSRNVGVSPLNSGCPSLFKLLGIGIVIVIGLWNFLRLGSNVTIELNAALFPRIFFTKSTSIGWA